MVLGSFLLWICDISSAVFSSSPWARLQLATDGWRRGCWCRLPTVFRFCFSHITIPVGNCSLPAAVNFVDSLVPLHFHFCEAYGSSKWNGGIVQFFELHLRVVRESTKDLTVLLFGRSFCSWFCSWRTFLFVNLFIIGRYGVKAFSSREFSVPLQRLMKQVAREATVVFYLICSCWIYFRLAMVC